MGSMSSETSQRRMPVSPGKVDGEPACSFPILVSYNDTKEASTSRGLWVWFKPHLWYRMLKGIPAQASQEAECLVINGKVRENIKNRTSGVGIG